MKQTYRVAIRSFFWVGGIPRTTIHPLHPKRNDERTPIRLRLARKKLLMENREKTHKKAANLEIILAQKNPCPVSFKCRSNICICFQALSAHAVARSQGKRPMLSVNTSTHTVWFFGGCFRNPHQQLRLCTLLTTNQATEKRCISITFTFPSKGLYIIEIPRSFRVLGGECQTVMRLG